MLSRRSLISALSLAGGVIASPSAACPVAGKLFRSNDRTKFVLLQRAQEFRSQFNKGEFDKIVSSNKLAHVSVLEKSDQDYSRILTKFHEEYGRILNPVIDDNMLIWPESAKITFIATMETMPEDDALGWGLGCGPSGGHKQFAFTIRCAVNRETQFLGKIEQIEVSG